MKIIKQTGTANTTYAPRRKIEYLAIHYTAGVSSKAGSASGSASWFANPAADGSADYIVDEETFIQYNPDPYNRYCHAVGGAKYNTQGGRLYGVAKNSNCISLEICSTNSKGKITYPNDPAYSFTARTIREEDLQAAVARAVNDAWGRKDDVVSTLKENVRAVLEKGAERRLGKVETAIKKKQTVLLNTVEKGKLKKIEKELRSLQDKEQALLEEVARNRELQERVEEMESFLDEQNQEVEYSEALVRRLVKRIEVFDSKISVEFKSGLVVNV